MFDTYGILMQSQATQALNTRDILVQHKSYIRKPNQTFVVIVHHHRRRSSLNIEFLIDIPLFVLAVVAE